MWQNLQNQIKALMDSTLVTYTELGKVVSVRMGMKVHSTEISHAVNDERGATRKGRQILRHSLDYLTEVQESQNREVAQQMRRAEKALSNAK